MPGSSTSISFIRNNSFNVALDLAINLLISSISPEDPTPCCSIPTSRSRDVSPVGGDPS